MAHGVELKTFYIWKHLPFLAACNLKTFAFLSWAQQISMENTIDQ